MTGPARGPDNYPNCGAILKFLPTAMPLEPTPNEALPELQVVRQAAVEADRALHAAIARASGGISPASLIEAWIDWATHLALAPSKQFELYQSALQSGLDLATWFLRDRTHPPRRADPRDPRFRSQAWELWPFDCLELSFLAAEAWWHDAASGVRGVTRHHEQLVEFFARQWLDVFAPSNFAGTNPEVLLRSAGSAGLNFMQGAANFWEDLLRQGRELPPVGAEQFVPGVRVAVTPGRVVFCNDLIELIQYWPSTPAVFPEPVLLVPAWIMKYYILDLSPQNSLVKYLVDRGHTVFAISWKNPDQSDRELALDDYRRRGLMAAIDAVADMCGGRKIHAVGYCLGGTLLAIGAAAMARDGDHRLATLTLLAAQTDFTEPGELGLFIDESQLTFLGDLMQRQGYLRGDQMAGAFQLMRSIDLIWSRIVHEYLMGERPPMTDLMAWNADATRMPARMHSEYLRELFLDNRLATGQYRVDGRPVALADVRLPVFCVATQTDHVAPWRSVYKLHLLTDAEITFVLTSGGHNVGVVNPPLQSHYDYRVAVRPTEGTYLDPDAFLREARAETGSWWPAWHGWLQQHGGEAGEPPPLGSASYPALYDAPGEYVHIR
jgi:polyhydroxyalkanoate synthase